MLLKCRKWLSLVVAMLFILTVLTACGGTPSGGEGSLVSVREEDMSLSDSSVDGTDADSDAATTANDSADSQTANKTTKKTEAKTTKKTTAKTTTKSTVKSTTSTTKEPIPVVKNPPVVKADPNGVLDYIVEVESGRDITVLQLTDPQIMDTDYEDKCFKYIRETVKKARPDLILVTGDVVYGRFDNDGKIFKAFVEFMDGFAIPWAPVYGNHDAEAEIGVDWQCQQYEAAKNCLFVQRTLTGNGNYSIGLKQDGTVKRVIFMLDSNGYHGKALAYNNGNSHTVTTVGFGEDQETWYSSVASQVKGLYPKVKFTFAFHVQTQMFAMAFAKYGFDGESTVPINLDTKSGVADSDFGYIGRVLKDPWDTDYSLYNTMKHLGVDSVLVGHEHCNSASVVHQGIRYQYGQKSSVYDRANYLMSDGSIAASGSVIGTPILGGTVLQLSKTDGAIKDAYIQYWNK